MLDNLLSNEKTCVKMNKNDGYNVCYLKEEDYTTLGFFRIADANENIEVYYSGDWIILDQKEKYLS